MTSTTELLQQAEKSAVSMAPKKGIAVGKTGDKVWPARYPEAPVPPLVKKQLLATQLGINPRELQYTIETTPDDETAIQDRHKIVNQMRFDEFFASLIGDKIQDPVYAEYARKIYPEYFENRLQSIDDHLELQHKVASLGINGIQSQEDLMFMFQLAKHRKEIEPYLNSVPGKTPAKGVDDILHDTGFIADMFNLRKYSKWIENEAFTKPKPNQTLLDMFTEGWELQEAGEEGILNEWLPIPHTATQYLGKQKVLTRKGAPAAAAPTEAGGELIQEEEE